MEDADSENERAERDSRTLTQAQAFILENKPHLLKEFLAREPDMVHRRTLSGNFLTIAIQHDNLEATQILLDAGMSPLEDDSRGNCFLTALEHASAHGNRDIWRLLLDRLMMTRPTGIVVCGQNEQELLNRSLVEAAVFGHAGIVAEFMDALEWSSQVLLDALVCAAERWHADIVDLLLEKVQFDKEDLRKALDRSLNDRINGRDAIGDRAHFSQFDKETHYRLVGRLIDASGINLGLEGSALLRKAIEGTDKQGALKALLEKGADPNTQWEKGSTALHLLAFPISSDPTTRRERIFHNDLDPLNGYEMHEAGIGLLVDHGASITIKDDEGSTASHLAAEGSTTNIFLRYYLPAQSDLMQTNGYGESLLHYAAAGGKHETIKHLLSQCSGFDVNTPGSTGWTPLICALAPNCRVYKTELAAVKSARLLLSRGADPTLTTSHGWTTLHVAGSYQDRTEWTAPKNEAPGTRVDAEMDAYDPEEDWLENPVRWVRMSEAEYEERFGLLDDNTNATQLVRELLSNPLHHLPPLESLARVYVGDIPYWQHPRDRIAWGAMLDKALAQADEVRYSSPTKHGLATLRKKGRQGFDPTRIKADWTPLHWAVRYGATGVARLLCEHGADKSTEDSEGETPLHLAHQNCELLGSKSWDFMQKAVS